MLPDTSDHADTTRSTETPTESVLVVVDDVLDDPTTQIPQWAIDATTTAASVHVIAPLIGTRLAVASADERMYQRARTNLATVLGAMQTRGIAATGEIIESGPLAAIETAITERRIDLIIIGMHAVNHWQERHLIDTLAQHHSIPVRTVTKD